LAYRQRLDMGFVMAAGALDLRPYREGDEEAILRILNQASEARFSLDQWAWLLPIEADGRAIVVGERDNEVVAVCAGSPVGFAIDGGERAALQLHGLASRDRGDLDRVLDFFVKTFGSVNRFALATASFDFEGAAPAPVPALIREGAGSVSLRRFLYRAEPARDWEPRLDALWERVRGSYPNAVVRNAELALRRFAGHPSMKHHGFLVFPRYSCHAVAFAVFADDGSSCCWLDLIWDHGHPGALDLLAHISRRLVAQWGSSGERVWLAGDDEASHLLVRRGFRPDTSSPPVVSTRSFTPDLDAGEIVGRAYLTVADAGGLCP
jgi:hypothetical protein